MYVYIYIYIYIYIYNFNGLHEIKTKNRKLNSHQDLCNNSARTPCYHEKESTNQDITILSNIISNNIYNNLHHFGNDITVQVDKGNTKTKQIQRTQTVRRSQIIQTKGEEISSPMKLFDGATFSYFPGICVSKRFYNNLISKSRSHLTFTVRLSFYVFFVGLISRNYLLSPKLNHGFSGENTTFSKI